jgi:hypothetical protein
MRLQVTRCGQLALVLFAATSFLSAADIPKGTKITVRLESLITSASAEFGQTFDASLTRDFVVNHRTVAAAGSKAEVMIVKAQSSGNGYAAFITVKLTSLEGKSATYVLDTYDVTRQGSGKASPSEPRPTDDVGPMISGIGKRPSIPTMPGVGPDQGVVLDKGSGPDVILPPGALLTFQARADAEEVTKP